MATKLTQLSTTDDYAQGLGKKAGGDFDAIKTLEWFRVRPRWLFVRVETDSGIIGWGGKSQHIPNSYQTATRHRFYRHGEVLMSALSGLDIALWDIKGKRHNVPIWELLGGKVRERALVYGWIGGDRPSDVLEQAKARKEQGFVAVKMNATESLGWLDSPSALDDTVERLRQVKSIGIDAGLDFHGRVHKPMAKQLVRRLEQYMPLFVEEPLLPDHVPELKTLHAQTTIPIALGERLYTREQVRPYLEAGCIDLLQPDIAHSGGISETKKIANMAEEPVGFSDRTYDVAIAPHCPLGPIAFAACLQIAFSSPNFVINEMSIGMHYNKGTGADLLTYLSNPEVFDVDRGTIPLLTGAGLGIQVNETLVRQAAAESKDFSWKNPVFRGPDGAVREW
ncbi:hypothetical protein OIV83_002553 [Microbotryomycetes sp. JL201]|nr:hypothetical protein OIV83_002553 [Microbotryomycetes sp. JL201]